MINQKQGVMYERCCCTASTDGQTKKIMTHIANELRQQGYECDVRDLTAVHHSP